MNQKELKERFKVFAISVIRFAKELPESFEFKVIRNQIVRSGTSSAANYRAACRGRSIADFIAKLKIVEEELDETQY